MTLLPDNTEGKIRLNIGGVEFITLISTLQRYPDTRLGRLVGGDVQNIGENDVFFFDRNPHLFHFILDLYRKRVFHFPQNICGPTMKDELEYWKIPEDCIAGCCMEHYREVENQEKLDRYLEEECYGSEAQDTLHKGNFMKRIYIFLEYPNSSRGAKVNRLNIDNVDLKTFPNVAALMPFILWIYIPQS